MAFVWKEHGAIFKGEGVYFLTFVVMGRRPLLGELVPIERAQAYSRGFSRRYARDVQRPDGMNGNGGKYTSRIAAVELSRFGFAVSEHVGALSERVEGLTVCAKQLMPDHIHVVVWMKRETGKSIRQIGNGFRIGVKRLAVEMGLWTETQGHILEVPFIRTLAHAGQLRSMIDYTHGNPDSAWLRRCHPDMYVIHRNLEVVGLYFDVMGKDRLLDYPDRQVVMLSRSLTKEQIDDAVRSALVKAERGAVTYTAAISEGEKAVARAVREAGFPLVILMLDGFPEEGTEAARYFHPSGVYHTACGEGRLLLMAPLERNYGNDALVMQTEEELRRKAAEKGVTYAAIPPTSKRWRMIAGNMMLRMLSSEME